MDPFFNMTAIGPDTDPAQFQAMLEANTIAVAKNNEGNAARARKGEIVCGANDVSVPPPPLLLLSSFFFFYYSPLPPPPLGLSVSRHLLRESLKKEKEYGKEEEKGGGGGKTTCEGLTNPILGQEIDCRQQCVSLPGSAMFLLA